MALPILYSFRRCPYAIRARLALRVAGTPVLLREVALRDKPAALLGASPKGTVPVLQLPDGRVLDESLDIMRWALAQADPEGWLRADEAAAVQAWVQLNDGAFKQALDRYKYAPPLEREAPRDQAVALMLVPMHAALARHGCLLRATPCVADMALLPFVRQFAGVDPGWFAHLPLPHLQAWLQRLTATPLFAAVGVKHPVWQPGAADTAF